MDCTFAELLLYMADAPKLISGKKADTKVIETDEELADWLGIEKKPTL